MFMFFRDRLVHAFFGLCFFRLYQKYADNEPQFYGPGSSFFDLFTDLASYIGLGWMLVHLLARIGSIWVPFCGQSGTILYDDWLNFSIIQLFNSDRPTDR